MDFTLKIRCENAAFQDGHLHTEVARLLREASTQIRQGRNEAIIRDGNGNRVGKFEFKEEQ